MPVDVGDWGGLLGPIVAPVLFLGLLLLLFWRKAPRPPMTPAQERSFIAILVGFLSFVTLALVLLHWLGLSPGWSVYILYITLAVVFYLEAWRDSRRSASERRRPSALILHILMAGGFLGIGVMRLAELRHWPTAVVLVALAVVVVFSAVLYRWLRRQQPPASA